MTLSMSTRTSLCALVAVAGMTSAASADIFTSAGGIIINDSGPATPYGTGNAAITVAGMTGATAVTVTLSEVIHTFPDDFAALLVAPNGANVLLFSGAGGSTGGSWTWTFDDLAGAMLPTSGALSSGTFLPGADDWFNDLPAPAPAGPYGTSLAAPLGGGGPDGVWQLFVVDFNSGDDGIIAGWSLNFTVPTPGAAALLGLGGIVGLRRRRAN